MNAPEPWMPMDVDGHGKDYVSEDAQYEGLDPNISDEFVATQFYAGMEKLESYLSPYLLFLDYLDAR